MATIGREVPRTASRATAPEALAAISEAHEVVVGVQPTLDGLLLLAGQSGLETGRWQRFYNNNPGGVKATPGGPYDYATYMTTEVLKGKTVKLPQHFRAYPTLAAGMVDWIALLKTKYAAAFAILDQPFDPEGFVKALKGGRYFTGDEATYARNVRSLALEFGRLPMAWPPLVRTLGDDLLLRVWAHEEGNGDDER